MFYVFPLHFEDIKRSVCDLWVYSRLKVNPFAFYAHFHCTYRKGDVMNLLESAGFSRSNPYYIVKQGKVCINVFIISYTWRTSLCLMNKKYQVVIIIVGLLVLFVFSPIFQFHIVACWSKLTSWVTYHFERCQLLALKVTDKFQFWNMTRKELLQLSQLVIKCYECAVRIHVLKTAIQSVWNIAVIRMTGI